MKRLVSFFAVLLVALVFVVGLCALSGCDEGTGRALTVDPSTVTLRGTTNTVMLMVTTNSLRDLSLPITWRVTNQALGSVVASEGPTAQYSRTSLRGLNVVVARDQYGAEGFATISQQ